MQAAATHFRKLQGRKVRPLRVIVVPLPGWHTRSLRGSMLTWAIIFLVVALVAGVLGFTNVAGTAATIAKVLFVLFLIVAILMFLL